MRLKFLCFILILGINASCLPETKDKPKFQNNFQTISQPYVDMFKADRIYISSKYATYGNQNQSSLSLRIQNPQNFNAYFDKIEEMSLSLAKSIYTHLINKQDYQSIEIIYEDRRGHLSQQNTSFFKINFSKDDILREIKIEEKIKNENTGK